MEISLRPTRTTIRDKAGNVIRVFSGTQNVDGDTVAYLVQLEEAIKAKLYADYSVAGVECTVSADTYGDDMAAVYMNYTASRPANISEKRELEIRENGSADRLRQVREQEFERLKKLLGKE